MINKKYDMALIGNNYLSFLLSVELMEWDKKVILIDDERVKYGQHFTDYLCQFESYFLNYWGEDRQLEPLQNLQHYIVKKPFSIILGDRRVLLGHGPASNLLELMRKFPSLFEGEDFEQLSSFISTKEKKKIFDESYNSFCNRLAENSFRFRTSRNISFSHFISLCPEEIKLLFKSFSKNLLIQKKRNKELGDSRFFKSFLYLTRGLFHRKLSTFASELELFHLFLSLLSPHYELDHQALTRDLLPLFVERGGVFKKTQVKEWLFDKKRPWALELSSYEGIIHPEKILILGGRPFGLPVKMKVKEKSYRSVHLNFSFDEREGSDLGIEGQRVFYSRKEKIGGVYPFWEGRFHKKGGELKIYTESCKGMKINVLKPFLISQLEEDLSRISKRVISNLKVDYLEFGPEACLEEGLFQKESSRHDMQAVYTSSLYDCSSPGEGSRLKNVYYFGPLKRGPSLGLFSTMMDIKDGPSL